MRHRVGLVGAGGAGTKRAAAVIACDRSQLVKVCDLNRQEASSTAIQADADVVDSWEDVVNDNSIDIVIISTTHDQLSLIGCAAAAAGKHILCEKPLGRNPIEVQDLVRAVEANGVCLRAGYNHRFHPSIMAMHQAVEEGRLGNLDFIRGHYGHGGRLGYDREWRGDAEKAGGGELLDQGAHLIDLSLWLLGDFESVTGFTERRCWDIDPLEDNAFGLFRTAAGQVASIHASWTQWKNLFSLEVFGSQGYAVATGRGGSYGPESIRIGCRRIGGGPPEENKIIFDGNDCSWDLEWKSLLSEIDGKITMGANGESGLNTMRWIYRLYRAASTHRVVLTDEPIS